MSVLIENYIPVIKQQGFNTAKDVTITGAFTATGTNTLTAPALGAATATTINVSGATTLAGALIGTPQALSGAGAINLTTTVTKVTSTGANALTLADGTDGQVKIIAMVVDGGDATLTPTTKTGYSTIVFNDAGDGVILVFTTTTGWIVVANNGATIS